MDPGWRKADVVVENNRKAKAMLKFCIETIDHFNFEKFDRLTTRWGFGGLGWPGFR